MFGQKILICVALVVCWGSFVVEAGIGTEEKAAMMIDLFPLYVKCIKGPPLTPQQVKDLRKTDLDTFACYYSCFLKNVGVVDDDNVLSADKVSEVARRYIKDSETLEKLETVAKDCSKVNAMEVKEGDVSCGKAKLLLECAATHKDISIFAD